MSDLKTKKYFYGKHKIDNNDLKAVIKSIKSGTISQGNQLIEFEKRVSNFCKAKYCLAVSSGTAALHIAVLSLNLGKSFFGLTSPITFAATPNSIIASGGKLGLIDINKKTLNLSYEKFLNLINFKKKNKLKMPNLVIPVSFAGSSSEMKEIFKIAKKNKIKVIEDASQAMGATYKKEKLGSCKYSDITVFSLHPVKTITSAEGGLILTNNKKLYDRMKLLRVNGVKKNNNPSWTHDVITFGLNYKISELNCALGNSQLKKINKFINARKNIANYYKKTLDNKIFRFQLIDQNSSSAWHLFIIIFKKKITKSKKMNFYKILTKKNIFLDLKYKPINLMPYYKKKFKLKRYPEAENYFNQAFCLPIYPGLSKNDLKYIVANINKTARDLKL